MADIKTKQSVASAYGIKKAGHGTLKRNVENTVKSASSDISGNREKANDTDASNYASEKTEQIAGQTVESAVDGAAAFIRRRDAAAREARRLYEKSRQPVSKNSGYTQNASGASSQNPKRQAGTVKNSRNQGSMQLKTAKTDNAARFRQAGNQPARYFSEQQPAGKVKTARNQGKAPAKAAKTDNNAENPSARYLKRQHIKKVKESRKRKKAQTGTEKNRAAKTDNAARFRQAESPSEQYSGQQPAAKSKTLQGAGSPSSAAANSGNAAETAFNAGQTPKQTGTVRQIPAAKSLQPVQPAGKGVIKKVEKASIKTARKGADTAIRAAKKTGELTVKTSKTIVKGAKASGKTVSSAIKAGEKAVKVAAGTTKTAVVSAKTAAAALKAAVALAKKIVELLKTADSAIAETAAVSIPLLLVVILIIILIGLLTPPFDLFDADTQIADDYIVRSGYIVYIALDEVGNNGDKYNQWYDNSSHNNWCAIFVSWCADQCGYIDSGVMPKSSVCELVKDWYINNNQFIPSDGFFVPSPGMVIFFDLKNEGETNHMGLVKEVLINPDGQTIVYTIEGNADGLVKERCYNLNDSRIVGYGCPAY